MQPAPGAPRQTIEVNVVPAPTDLPLVGVSDVKLADDDLILGVLYDDRAVAFPVHRSPDPGSCTREFEDEEPLTFDFCAALVHDNLLIVDRQTDSIWSQLEGKAISGPLTGTPLKTVPALQTTWRFWRDHHANTEVLIIEGQKGHIYKYHLPEQGPTSPLLSHDTSQLGLGLSIEGKAWFLPLSELRKPKDPLQIRIAGHPVTVHYSQRGLTAWAEDRRITIRSRTKSRR